MASLLIFIKLSAVVLSLRSWSLCSTGLMTSCFCGCGNFVLNCGAVLVLICGPELDIFSWVSDGVVVMVSEVTGLLLVNPTFLDYRKKRDRKIKIFNKIILTEQPFFLKVNLISGFRTLVMNFHFFQKRK